MACSMADLSEYRHACTGKSDAADVS